MNKRQPLSEVEKNEAWERAKAKANELYTGENNRDTTSKYKTWVVMLQPEDIDDLSSEELLDVIYKYKGKKNLWEQGTKEDDFDGVYKSQHKNAKSKK